MLIAPTISRCPSHPQSLADIHAVVCLIAMLARWAFLTGMSWVNHLYLDAESRSFVGDECGELIERPAVLGHGCFSGHKPHDLYVSCLDVFLQGIRL